MKALSFLKSGRFWVAGPLTLLASLLFMSLMPLWLPEGEAGINHVMFPAVLLPLIWAAIFFYAVLAHSVKQAAWVVGGLTIFCAVFAFMAVSGWF